MFYIKRVLGNKTIAVYCPQTALVRSGNFTERCHRTAMTSLTDETCRAMSQVVLMSLSAVDKQ